MIKYDYVDLHNDYVITIFIFIFFLFLSYFHSFFLSFFLSYLLNFSLLLLVYFSLHLFSSKNISSFFVLFEISRTFLCSLRFWSTFLLLSCRCEVDWLTFIFIFIFIFSIICILFTLFMSVCVSSIILIFDFLLQKFNFVHFTSILTLTINFVQPFARLLLTPVWWQFSFYSFSFPSLLLLRLVLHLLLLLLLLFFFILLGGFDLTVNVCNLEAVLRNNTYNFDIAKILLNGMHALPQHISYFILVFIYPLFACLFVCLFVFLFFCLFACLFVCLFVIIYTEEFFVLLLSCLV